MRVEYYLNDSAVCKPVFKQFSSQCHLWQDLLELYNAALHAGTPVLKLVYVPRHNQVKAYYKSSVFLDMISEEVLKAKRKHSDPLRSISAAEPVLQN